MVENLLVWLRGSAEVPDALPGSECSGAGAAVGRQDGLAGLCSGAPYQASRKSGSGEAADAQRGRAEGLQVFLPVYF